MAQATFQFPRRFLWGTATSSHQVEGNNLNNNWWAWEQQSGRIRNGDRSGLACDWWGGRWKEDFDRAANAGQNAHRLSIEWSRVQPEPDRWDETAIDRYIAMLRGLCERKLAPLVTLHHFSDPLWLEEQGGWEDESIVRRFSAYVERVVEALREYTSLWVTINEPNVLCVSAYLAGSWPPGKKSPTSMVRVMSNLVRAHAAAYHIIHRLQPQAQVGMAINYLPFQPISSWSLLQRLAAGLADGIFNEFFPAALHSGRLRFPLWSRRIPEARGTQDFLGINYYTRGYLSSKLTNLKEMIETPPFPPGSQVSPSGMIANEPVGIFEALKWGLKFERADDRHRERDRGPGGPAATELPDPTPAPGLAGGEFQLPGAEVISTGRWWIISNGSAAGRSDLGCGSWMSTPRRAASAPVPTCTQRSAWRMVSPRIWCSATHRRSPPACSPIDRQRQVMDTALSRASALFRVVCRPALPKDKADVLALTRDIWEGNDYVPEVWDEWLADPEGLLAVAEYGGQVVGLVKLSRKGSGDWWLEGLRVHPQYQGRGIASHMHDYILDSWRRDLGGVIRLATSSKRLPVHRLCQRTGFELVGDYRLFTAPSMTGEGAAFRLVQEDEASQAQEYLLDSQLFALCGSLLYLDWSWGSLSIERITEIIRGGQAYWWLGESGEVRGMLCIAVDEDDEHGRHPFVQLLGCEQHDLPELLLAYRRLSGQMGFGRVEWLAPNEQSVETYLQGAGYQSDWESSLYLFEKRA